jgi:hypothetical protein
VETEIQLNAFLKSALDGGEWSVSRPGRFTPEQTAFEFRWIDEWVGSINSRKSNPVRPAPNLVTILTELYKLLSYSERRT